MQEMQERQVWSLRREDPLEKETAPCSSILACEIPWTEETDVLQSMGWQRVGHEWAQEERHWYHDAKTAVLYYWWGIWNPSNSENNQPSISPGSASMDSTNHGWKILGKNFQIANICHTLATIYVVFVLYLQQFTLYYIYIARNLEMIPKVYGMMSAGYMQILSHFIWGTWASTNFGICRGGGWGIGCPGTNSRGYWRSTVVYLS